MKLDQSKTANKRESLKSGAAPSFEVLFTSRSASLKDPLVG